MANVRARVELRGCLTHTARGRTVERGRPFYTTNPADIAYYQSCGEYAVSMLQSEQPAAKPAKAKPTRPASPPPPPDPDEGDEGSSDEGGGEDDEDEEGESSDLSDAHYTKADLEKMTKPDLATLADEDFDLKLNPDSMNKPKMIGAILKAQIDKHKG